MTDNPIILWICIYYEISLLPAWIEIRDSKYNWAVWLCINEHLLCKSGIVIEPAAFTLLVSALRAQCKTQLFISKRIANFGCNSVFQQWISHAITLIGSAWIIQHHIRCVRALNHRCQSDSSISLSLSLAPSLSSERLMAAMLCSSELSWCVCVLLILER